MHYGLLDIEWTALLMCADAMIGLNGGTRESKAAPAPGTIVAKRSLRQFNSFVEGLSEGEIEVR